MKKAIWIGSYLNKEEEAVLSAEGYLGGYVVDFREFAKINHTKGEELYGSHGDWYEWFGDNHEYQAIFIVDCNNAFDSILELTTKMFYTVRFMECKNPMEETVDDYYELHEELENILEALKGGKQ